jgi:hypothetical protein
MPSHDLRADLSELAGLAELRDDNGVADLKSGLEEVRVRCRRRAREGAVAAEGLAAVGDDRVPD